MNFTKRQPLNNRILFVLDTSHGQIGGTEQNTLRFAQALAQKGYAPIIAEIGAAILHKSADANGLPLYNVPTTHFEEVRWGNWHSLLKKSDPAVIVRSKTWVGCVNWKLDILALLSNARYLGWEHHPARPIVHEPTILRCISKLGIRQIKARIKGFFRTQLHTKAVRRTIAVSDAVREPLISCYPTDPDKIDVVYPGVDFTLFTRQHFARKELRAQWNIPESAFVIGSLGRLVAHKGNDFALKVLADLMHRDPRLDVWCVLAGRGPDLARLQALVDSLKIGERVRFPGWQEDAPKTWSAFDLFMMPSSDEGLGMTLIEAVACGCLPLGAAVGGMKEILKGSLGKYCLPPHDFNAWVTTAADIIRIPPIERALLHQKAYEQLRSQFDSDQQWSSMVRWLELHSGIRS